jgi:hypothetical protein
MSEIVMGCDAIRREADPRFEYTNWDTFAPPPGTWAPDCGHAACVEDDKHCPSGDGFHTYDCPVAVCRWDTARATCDLDDGHDGGHRWYVPEPPTGHPNDEPAWPPPPIEGEPQPLPGFGEVEEKPAERRYPG